MTSGKRCWFKGTENAKILLKRLITPFISTCIASVCLYDVLGGMAMLYDHLRSDL